MLSRDRRERLSSRLRRPMLNRDRRERLSSRLGGFEDCHWITLLVNHVPNRRRHMLRLPQPPRAAMPRPPLSSRFIQSHSVQAAARVRLEVVHDSLEARLRFHHDVNVMGAHMGGQRAPVALAAALPQRGQHRLPAASVHSIRRLVHPSPLCGNPLRIGLDQRATRQIMPAIDGARFIAVQVAAVTGECNQVNHREDLDSVGTAPCGRGSAWYARYAQAPSGINLRLRPTYRIVAHPGARAPAEAQRPAATLRSGGVPSRPR